MTPAGIGGPAGVWDTRSSAVRASPSQNPIGALPASLELVARSPSSKPRTLSGEAYDNGVRRVVFRDADGNEFAFGGLPVDDT